MTEFPSFTPATHKTHGGTDATRASIPPGTGSAPRDRQQLLERLYEEQRQLRRAERLGSISNEDRVYLRDLGLEIDRYEAQDPGLAGGEIWRRVDALAARILGKVAVK